MSHNRTRRADFCHSLESLCNTDCGTDLNTALQRISTSQSSLQSYGNRRIDSMMLGLESTIQSDIAIESDSRSSTENSYKTARTTSVEADTISTDASAACRGPPQVRFVNRAMNVEFDPWPELDLTPSIGKDSHCDGNKHISKEGFSACKMVGSSSGVNNCALRHCITREPRSAQKVPSRLDNASNPWGDRTMISKDNICKLIQNESMPQWAPSFCVHSALCTSKYPDDNNLDKFRRANAIVQSPGVSSATGYKTPRHDHETNKIYRKTPVNIFGGTFGENQAFRSPGSPLSLDTTKGFEKLEKYLEGFPSSPANRSRNLRRSLSASDVSVILRDKLAINYPSKCTNANALDTFDSHCGWGAQDKYTVNEPTVKEDEINEGELSSSLLIEWRKKRQRCFDTAMKMQEIVLESKIASNDNAKVLDRYVDPSNEFIKTITTSSEYQNCLASLRQNVNFKRTDGSSADSRMSFDRKSSSDESHLPVGHFESPGKNSNYSPPALRDRKPSGNSIVDAPQSTPRRARSPRSDDLLPATRVTPLMINHRKDKITKTGTCQPKSSPVSAETAQISRRKYFVTPGKIKPVNNDDKKRIYFPNFGTEVSKDVSRRVMKSLHAPGLYRLGYQTVISPVRMYIKGTDMNLIQNTREKKNEMLLTPRNAATSEDKLKFKLSGRTKTSRRTPQKNALLTCKELDANDENIPEPDFALPKATYRLPAQVRTVNESPTYYSGARTRGLLQSMQNRLVIRHEGKRFEKTDGNRTPGSGGDSTDMSVHVQKSAKKTNYMSHWK